jgi:hypothetical protein
LPSALEAKAKDFVQKFSLKEKNPNILKEEELVMISANVTSLGLHQAFNNFS